MEQLKANNATTATPQSPAPEWLSQSPSSSTSTDTDDVESDPVSFPHTSTWCNYNIHALL